MSKIAFILSIFLFSTHLSAFSTWKPLTEDTKKSKWITSSKKRQMGHWKKVFRVLKANKSLPTKSLSYLNKHRRKTKSPHLRKLIPQLVKLNRSQRKGISIVHSCKRILRINAHEIKFNSIKKQVTKFCYSKSFGHLVKSRPKQVRKLLKKHRSFYVSGLRYLAEKKRFKTLTTVLEFINNLDTKTALSYSNIGLMKEIERSNRPVPIELINLLAQTPEAVKRLQGRLLSSPVLNPNYFDIYQKQIGNQSKELILDNQDNQLVKHVQHFKNYSLSNKQFIGKKKMGRNVIGLGKKLMIYGHNDLAQSIFDPALVDQSTIQQDFHTFNLIGFYLEKKTDQAQAYIKKNRLIANFESFGSKLMFWIAKSIEISGKKDQSTKLYSQLIKTHPLSFYGTHSLKILSSTNPNINSTAYQLIERFKQESDKTNLKLYKTNKALRNKIANYLTLNEIGGHRLAKSVKADIIDLAPEGILFKDSPVGYDSNHLTNILLSTLNSKMGHHLQSFQVLYKNIDEKMIVNRNILDLLFPIKHLERIKKHSKDVAPLLILSLIRQESAFNPRAKSRVGARGLMQLMLPTARTMQRRVRAKQLYRPATNIRLGIKYLERLYRKYDENIVYTLAAYNAGEGRVNRWIKSVFFTEDPLVAIEFIPFKETRLYVQLILRNLFFYQLLDQLNQNKETKRIVFNDRYP